MGNSLGGGKTTKIMKINGETIKLKTPVQAGEVTKDYPAGFVLLESEAVKHFGIRAKPLGVDQQLKAKRLYFLVELPKFSEEKAPRKVRSGIVMSAKDRLDSLMLARRSVSDLSLLQPKSNIIVEESGEEGSSQNGSNKTKIKMRLPKADVEKLMRESKTEAEAADKIMQLYLSTSSNHDTVHEHGSPVAYPQVHSREGGQGRIGTGGLIARQRRVGFMPINEGEIQVAMA